MCGLTYLTRRNRLPLTNRTLRSAADVMATRVHGLSRVFRGDSTALCSALHAGRAVGDRSAALSLRGP